MSSSNRSVRGYTIYSIIGTLVELGILLAIVLWGLPFVGINIPPWGLAVLIIVLLGFSYYTYHMGRKALTRRFMHDQESIIGCEGRVMESFEHSGYVKIGNELWKATSEVPLDGGTEVVVTEVDGLKIKVAPITPPHSTP